MRNITFTLSDSDTHKEIAKSATARKIADILLQRRNLGASTTYVTEWIDDEIASQVNGEEFLREMGYDT